MRERGPCDDHAILVVDDDEAIRWLLREILSSEGYAVRVEQPPCRPAAILPKPFDLDQLLRRVHTLVS
jgi:DNA-binding response OmpR family regulator